MGRRRREVKHLAIPDNLFWVVRGASGLWGFIVLRFQIGDGGEPISGKGVSIGVGRDWGKGVSDGRCRGLLSREDVLKGEGDWQI